MVTPTICLPSINFFLAVLYMRTGPFAFLQSCWAKHSIAQTAPQPMASFQVISPPGKDCIKLFAAEWVAFGNQRPGEAKRLPPCTALMGQAFSRDLKNTGNPAATSRRKRLLHRNYK